jgi:hypothetical protein
LCDSNITYKLSAAQAICKTLFKKKKSSFATIAASPATKKTPPLGESKERARQEQLKTDKKHTL